MCTDQDIEAVGSTHYVLLTDLKNTGLVAMSDRLALSHRDLTYQLLSHIADFPTRKVVARCILRPAEYEELPFSLTRHSFYVPLDSQKEKSYRGKKYLQWLLSWGLAQIATHFDYYFVLDSESLLQQLMPPRKVDEAGLYFVCVAGREELLREYILAQKSIREVLPICHAIVLDNTWSIWRTAIEILSEQIGELAFREMVGKVFICPSIRRLTKEEQEACMLTSHEEIFYSV